MAGQKVVKKYGQNLVRNGWSENLMYCFVMGRRTGSFASWQLQKQPRRPRTSAGPLRPGSTTKASQCEPMHDAHAGSRKPGVPEAAGARRPLAAAGSRLRLELRHRPELGPQRLRRRRGAPPNLSTHWRGLPDRPARRRSLRAAGRSAEALPLRVHDDILRGRRWRPATAAPTSAHCHVARSGFWSKSGQKMAGQKVVRN